MSNVEFKETKLGLLPTSWEVKPLSFAAVKQKDAFVDGPFGSNLKTSDYTAQGVRLIQLQNIGDGIFIDDNKKYTSATKAQELNRHIAKPGDIVIAKMADPLARACIVPESHREWLIVADCIKLNYDTEIFDPVFLLALINSDVVRSQALARSTGTTRKRIGLSELKKLLIPVPPLDYQQRMSNILLDIQEKDRALEAERRQLAILRQGVIQNLLTAKLQIAVDDG